MQFKASTLDEIVSSNWYLTFLPTGDNILLCTIGNFVTECQLVLDNCLQFSTVEFYIVINIKSLITKFNLNWRLRDQSWCILLIPVII